MSISAHFRLMRARNQGLAVRGPSAGGVSGRIDHLAEALCSLCPDQSARGKIRRARGQGVQHAPRTETKRAAAVPAASKSQGGPRQDWSSVAVLDERPRLSFLYSRLAATIASGRIKDWSRIGPSLTDSQLPVDVANSHTINNFFLCSVLQGPVSRVAVEASFARAVAVECKGTAAVCGLVLLQVCTDVETNKCFGPTSSHYILLAAK
ncbi:hypothetical protein IWZ00DRAFT_138529 [Phyllosticta capitalensis]|uniref:Uncharacterized protein n=1 Tax=Phyllosticta capitalensis TaxID=121624 RepID=A0ABR1Z0W1_9PEZI